MSSVFRLFVTYGKIIFLGRNGHDERRLLDESV